MKKALILAVFSLTSTAWALQVIEQPPEIVPELIETPQRQPSDPFVDEASITKKEAVQALKEEGIIKGYDDGSFGPKNPINRAESLKVIFEALGVDIPEPENSFFSDVPKDAWFAKYVQYAKEQGIVKGYEDGTFQPAKIVNQAELIKIALVSFKEPIPNSQPFTLVDKIDKTQWYAPYIQYAFTNKIIDQDEIDPAGDITREAFADVIYKLMQR